MGIHFGEIITILRYSSTELTPYGDLPTPVITRIDISNAGIAPRMSNESTNRGRQGLTVGYSLYLPYGTDLRFNDKVELFGGGTLAGAPRTPATVQIYYVDGQPAQWKSALSGKRFGMEVSLSLGSG